MPAERPKRPRARLFIALDLPQEVLATISRWQRKRLAGIPGLRPLRPDHLHATLVFLGYQAERDIGRIARAAFAEPLAHRPVALALGEVRPVPPRRPRLFAITVDDAAGDLARIQGTLSRRLQEAGFYRPEKRPFWPHVTVARFGSRRRERGSDPPPPPEGPARAFLGVRLTLYRSVLRPEGARYESLAHLEFAGAGSASRGPAAGRQTGSER